MERRTQNTIFVLAIIFAIFTFVLTDLTTRTKVIKLESALEIYIDKNKNQTADKDELIQFNEINITPKYLTQSEAKRLNYLATQEAKKLILNENIKIKENKIILKDGKDYIKTLEEKGLLPNETNKNLVKTNIEKTKSMDLVSYHLTTQKFHKPECKYIQNSPIAKILPKTELPKQATPCKHCFIKKPEQTVFIEDFKTITKSATIMLYMTDFTKYNIPSNQCNTKLCQSLLKEIQNAKSNIDFAIYGINNQPEITKALISAQKRGVKIRWVYDIKDDNTTIYPDTLILKNLIPSAKSDTETTTKTLANGKILKDAIMHNKFFIFDNKKVWTGSANISNTDLSGFNANSAVLIESKEIAQIYKKEFEQMYNGNFHKLKQKNHTNKNIQNNNVEIYFSPQFQTIDDTIIPLINNAKNYIYIPVFVITYKDFNNALIQAKRRGVDIKIIVDATSAGSKYSSIKYLRNNGIQVKTENRAGKMHMKSIVIDDEYTIIGSMNLSKSGQNYNDENTVIIKNKEIAKVFKQNFLHLYNKIPNIWLYKNPQAESQNSINSCYDGIDNDFDGKIDKDDNSCNLYTKN